MATLKKQNKISLKTLIPSIKKLDFDTTGKIIVVLEDGRELSVPISYFPELKKLPVAARKRYTIVDDRTILFRDLNSIYHLEDFIGLEEKWRMR